MNQLNNTSGYIINNWFNQWYIKFIQQDYYQDTIDFIIKELNLSENKGKYVLFRYTQDYQDEDAPSLPRLNRSNNSSLSQIIVELEKNPIKEISIYTGNYKLLVGIQLIQTQSKFMGFDIPFLYYSVGIEIYFRQFQPTFIDFLKFTK